MGFLVLLYLIIHRQTDYSEVFYKIIVLIMANWPCCFAESFCTKVLQTLKLSFSQLEEKTKLELKLLQSDPQFWQVALRDKLLRVSQLFSSQATDQIHFNDAESRWAYLGTYTAAHATLVHATVTSGQFEPLTEFVKKAHKKERSVIQCFSQKILFEAKVTLASYADIL